MREILFSDLTDAALRQQQAKAGDLPAGDRDVLADLAICQAATPPPWLWDESDTTMRLIGDFGPNRHGMQILKAPKKGTPYAEYWPNEADAAFIAAARDGWPWALGEIQKWKRLALTCCWCNLACEDIAALRQHCTCCPEHPVTAATKRAEAAEAEVERLRERITQWPWDRNGVGPDVPVLQSRYDALKKRAAEANDEVDRLRAAIRNHRDQRGDDKCWEDDERLYAILPEGFTPPARDSAVELANCERYIACRHNPATEYVSPEREIERLRTNLATEADISLTMQLQRNALRAQLARLQPQPWTKALPTEPGVFWWREDISFEPLLLRLFERDPGLGLCVCRFGVAMTHHPSYFGGEWSGPIVPPSGDAIENCQEGRSDAKEMS